MNSSTASTSVPTAGGGEEAVVVFPAVVGMSSGFTLVGNRLKSRHGGKDPHSRDSNGDEELSAAPRDISAITLFVEDLEAAKQFYLAALGLPVAFEDSNSAVFKFKNTLINLLKTTAAAELIEPAVVGTREAGSRLQLTIDVDDVDAMCAELQSRGVKLLNGPMDRPWGVRTASFMDPAGHIWEIAK
jgi:catechol 2,3-dioxygenase-like lactoylglutathione lyase family enzyme